MNEIEKREAITDEVVIARALARVVSSAAFKKSNRSKLLLEYVVGKYLAGETNQINGTVIAQDILGYGSDFDASTNPVVRVQAGRMREHLAAYYRHSGVDDPVLIYIPKGTYAPQFFARDLEVATGNETKNKDGFADKNRPHTSLFIKWVAGGLLVAAIVLAGMFAWKYSATVSHKKLSEMERTIARYPTIVILPFQNLTGDLKNDIFKQGFQHQLASDLYQFRVIRVVLSGQTHSAIINAEHKIAHYSLEGTFLEVEEKIDLAVRLINLETGETVEQFRISRDIGDDSYFKALAKISSDLSSQFAGPDGVLVQNSLESIRQNLDLSNHSHNNIKAFECLALFGKFESNKTYENFRHADRCLQHQITTYPDDSSLLAAQAWLMAYGSPEWNFFSGEEKPQGYTLDRALKLSERAVALNPGNSSAFQYMALIQWRLGDKLAAIQSMRRSGQLNSAVPDYLANLGQFLSFGGDWPSGLKYTREAIARNPHPPYWYYTPLFVRAVMDEDAQKARLYAGKHKGFSGPDTGAYMLIAAAMQSDAETIAYYIPIVEAHAKANGGDPLYNARQWMQSPEILAALEAELTRVGVSVPAAH